MKKLYLAGLCTLAVLLVACGGGGGDGAAAPAPLGSAALTVANQQLAAQAAMSGSFVTIDGVQALTGVRSVDEGVLFRAARHQMDKLPVYMAAVVANKVATGVISTQVLACTISGTATVSGVDADSNNVVSAGDSVTVTFNSCVEPEGTLGGSVTLAVNSLSGVFGSNVYSTNITMVFGNFSVADGLFIGTLGGSMGVALNVTGPDSYVANANSPSLQVTGNYSGVIRTQTLQTFGATATRLPDVTFGYTTSFTFSGTLISSDLSSQAVAITTLTPFLTRGIDVYPTSGVMLVTGAANSKLRLTAISNTQVLEELDANGDGFFESLTAVNWNTLL